MKKVLLVAGISLLGMGKSSIQAQTLTFGPEVGVNFSNFIHSNPNWDAGFIVGLKAGMNINFPIGNRSFINVGAFYLQRGGKLNNKNENTFSIQQMEYIGAPFMFIHRFKLNNGRAGSIYTGAGPYIAYGFGGQYKEYQVTGGTETEIANRKLEWGSGVNELRPLEYGISALVRYELPINFYIKAQYSNGFSNIYNSEHNKLRHQAFQLGVGFNFWTWIK